MVRIKRKLLKLFFELSLGSVFPIPLTTSNEDPNFQYCPNENGAYIHTTNCSLFHMCSFGIHTIYSCINGFYFNPTSHQCQYLLIVRNEFFFQIILYLFEY